MIIRMLIQRVSRIQNRHIYSALLVLFIFFSAYLMRLIEPETFDSYFNSLWWVMTTVTTVGYGDVSPTTTAGQIYAMTAVYIVGIGLMGLVIGYIVDAFQVYRKKKEEGKLAYKSEGHYIIVNYTKRSKETIEELLHIHDDKEIVIIDEDLDKKPSTDDRIHFVSGNPAEHRTLHQSNIKKSHAVLIFAPDNMKNYSLADGQTLLIATTIEGLGKEENFEVYTIAEILNDQHINAFQHADVDEFVTPYHMSARLIAKSASYRSASEVFRQLTSSRYGNDIYSIRKKKHWKTYRDAYQDLLESGATLLANGKEVGIAKKLNEPIPEQSELLIVCDQETYEAIK
ncbi:potassium channel protein [Halalkalibacillus sediminis]|uniref:BK channel n=1 Tax=Halalkalibacillus sediminis TaxID=2018042 RepID=A0A2I0QWQ3_9BACI|nr:potassium channel family protein [Halalkalibacillus sediminis]PKR78771.1 potassium channel protein [Halalkalibacillus sediminis]